MRRSALRTIAIALVALACCQSGCSSLRGPLPGASARSPRIVHLSSVRGAGHSRRSAIELEAAGDERAVDAYYAACRAAWERVIEDQHAATGATAVREHYNEQVAGLLRVAKRFGRLDIGRGLLIRSDDGWRTVPVVTRGFVPEAADRAQFRWPPIGREPLLARRYGRSGYGVPLVLERKRNDGDPGEARFLAEKSHFAATAVLRFDADVAPDSHLPAADDWAVLELINPLHEDAADLGVGPLPLAADLTAPLATTLEEAPRTYFAGFIEPGGATSEAKLTFLAPYEPGKVPVVLIHGLFSDPLSWGDLVNDLRAAPGFDQHYQFWVFRYPTGQGFLQSAAVLRRELRAAIEALDPGRSDPALRQIVLVGHSMGGLIAKLQVTYSEELIWSRLANRPLEEIVATDEARALLAETCYFDPSPDVARVIFVAAPHRGSLRSSGLVGQGAALLVEPAPAQARTHQQLVADNPGTWNPRFERRFPTSIDMLASESPLLDAMQKMRIRSGVKLHNILGVTHAVSLDGPSDGVVSVRSASHPGCQSVLGVGAQHTKVHRALDTSKEILRILGCSTAQHAVICSDAHPEAHFDSSVPPPQGAVRR